ncbi:carbamate kinase [Pseudonocardia acaciae]|uniref:carbamate kinase n=1 Tax=Pseudonocardia acaciae TaxID=551276 RepID=UPI0004900412|nr:carbamate kinase [Pseudonocardia acaciae]
MKIVAALGGNALLARGEPPDADIQEHHVLDAVRALAPLAKRHRLVITHGNGPQVGLLALESERDPSLRRPYPFDALGAQTQGMIGYWLVQALGNEAHVDAACLVCRTVVRADDPALTNPTKFVGPVYDRPTAHRLAAERGWRVRPDGPSWRRVVPSPEPAELVELPLIELLTERGTTVVCAGGGGIPVTRDATGRLDGVEAVVDKDLTAGLLAHAIDADALLLLTDVDAVYDQYGTARATAIRRATAGHLLGRSFPAGSMAPKIEAACRFVDAGGRLAAIGRLDDAERLLTGDTGTTITHGDG